MELYNIRQISEFERTSLTVCYVEEGEKGNEGNHGLSSYYRSGRDIPDNRHAKLANSASTATDDDDCSTVDIACEAKTEEAAEKTNACDHDRHRESIGDSCDGQEVGSVYVNPRRP